MGKAPSWARAPIGADSHDGFCIMHNNIIGLLQDGRFFVFLIQDGRFFFFYSRRSFFLFFIQDGRFFCFLFKMVVKK